jgi:hypothetical protein
MGTRYDRSRVVLRQALENSFAATMNRYAPTWMFKEAFSISVAVFKGVQQDLGSSFAVWSIFHHGQALNGLSTAGALRSTFTKNVSGNQTLPPPPWTLERIKPLVRVRRLFGRYQ